MVVYIACLLTTLLYGSESWTTLGKEKEKALRSLHVQPATPPGYHDTPWVSRHPLGIKWSDRVPNTEVLTHAGNQSMFTLLMQRRLRLLGHIHLIEDGRGGGGGGSGERTPKDLATTQLCR